MDVDLTMLTKGERCFLYLVNYARMRPDIAVKAIPILEQVR
jgi:hypothetical protein